MVPRVSLSLVFVKFRRLKVLGERGHVQCAIKWIGANVLKGIVFALAPSLHVIYLLDQGLYDVCEILWWL